ncbi:uncharacterized protein PV07_06175 [Cladophialophora immunda]|uniref:Peptidase S8/S53 domain-containing protein n=1 Tax=Cladophialophora immunda TaxID=569365 RepID=A0A0D2AYR8_9EURO|nr:uncharacterized protein PV07_06175 [Cladophialophora immunda]KIW30432.1 hypothetical protein PV07_06175 [Cladophialophora immunda]
MSDDIVINGRTVASSDQQSDATDSNYILVRTTGGPLNKAQKTELKALGVEIQEFVGNENDQLYLCGFKPASLDQIRNLDYISYANIYSPTFVVPDVLQSTTGTPALRTNEESDGTVEVDVLLHHDVKEASDDIVSKIAEAGNVQTSAITVEPGFVRVKVDPEKLDKIAAVDEVRVIHPINERRLFNNVARGILRLDGQGSSKPEYKGKDQIVCVADTGFDRGSPTDVHPAFLGRVKKLNPWGRRRLNLSDDPDGHGTHVCGSVLGSGQHNSQGLIQGGAPEATLMMQSTFSGFDARRRAQLGGIPNDIGRLFDEGYQAGARIHTNSWGTPLSPSGVQNPYDAGAESIDKFVFEHQDMTILFAAGNDGQDSDLDGKVNERSLGAEAAAKNCITVGASENNRPTLQSGEAGRPYTYGGFWRQDFPKNPLRDDHQANNPDGLAAFSSRGPTAENRLKPDLVAPGTAILSARSRNQKFDDEVKIMGDSGDDGYMYLSGTSMATPLVAGCCAVLREALVKNGYRDEEDGVKNPTGSLIKALLVNGAVAVKGQYVPREVNDDDGPNPHSGFGRVDVASSLVDPADKSSGYEIGAIEEDEEPVTFTITAPNNTGPDQPNGDSSTGISGAGTGRTLKVTMAYADLPGAALANDLNLVVVAGGKERHGNQQDAEFDVGAARPFDRRNNVEQVVWPRIPGGKVEVVVKPFRTVSDRVPFAVVWRFY